jgi:hypothetical protein
MRIVHGDQVAEKIRIHQHRQGVFRHRTVAAGEPGTPGNFILEMVRTTTISSRRATSTISISSATSSKASSISTVTER